MKPAKMPLTEEEILRSSSDEEVEDDASMEGSDGGGDGVNEVDSDTPLEMMDKDFIAATPEDMDKQGIENLCKQLFKYWDVDNRDLADLLIEQNYVTTVLKENYIGDEEDDVDDADVIYGVYSAVNMKTKKDSRCIKQIRDLIITHAAKSVDGELFKDILRTEGETPYTPGLLIKEKVVNIPGQVVAPFWKQLMNDLQDAVNKGMPYDFSHFIHVAKMVRLSKDDDYFVEQDDELMHKNNNRYFDVDYDSSIDASMVFENNRGKQMKGRAFRRFYLFTKEDVKKFTDDLTSLDQVKDVMGQAQSSGLK